MKRKKTQRKIEAKRKKAAEAAENNSGCDPSDGLSDGTIQNCLKGEPHENKCKKADQFAVCMFADSGHGSCCSTCNKRRLGRYNTHRACTG